MTTGKHIAFTRQMRSATCAILGLLTLPPAEAQAVGAVAKAHTAAPATLPQTAANLPEGFKLSTGSSTSSITPTAGIASPASGSRLINLYPIEYQGVPLAKGSDYLVIVNENGKLLSARLRNLPTSVDATTPTVATETAIAAAREAFEQVYGKIRVTVDPPTLEIWVDKQRLGHLSWKLTVRSGAAADPKSLQFWITATGLPKVLATEDLIYHASHHGKATASLSPAPPPPKPLI